MEERAMVETNERPLVIAQLDRTTQGSVADSGKGWDAIRKIMLAKDETFGARGAAILHGSKCENRHENRTEAKERFELLNRMERWRENSHKPGQQRGASEEGRHG
jgi:hypothetical protein